MRPRSCARPASRSSLFNVNPDDPRGWVPKTSGIGHTVHFRTRGQVRLFLWLMLGMLLSPIGLLLSVTP